MRFWRGAEWVARRQRTVGLRDLGHKRVCPLLVPDLGDRTVARVDHGLVGERVELLANPIGQRFEAAAGKIGPADAAAKQYVTPKHNSLISQDEYHVTRGVAGD